MKALVLELEDGRIAALREDGEIVTARREWAIGETVELDDSDLEFKEDNIVRLPVKKRRWVQAVIAASLAFVLLTGSYTYTTALACSYVSLETEETGVELAVNRLGRVIKVKALQEASEELAETLTAELRHRPVEEALEQTVERFREEGRLAGDETILAGVTDSNEQRAADLTEKLERAIGGQNELRTVEVSPEQREEAREQEMGGAAPEETPADRPQQTEGQAAPAKADNESEPPALPNEPGKSEQATGAVPEQGSQPSQQNDESAPAAPEDRQEPEPQGEPPLDGAPAQQAPGPDSGLGDWQPEAPQGADTLPGGNAPMNDRQPNENRR